MIVLIPATHTYSRFNISYTQPYPCGAGKRLVLIPPPVGQAIKSVSNIRLCILWSTVYALQLLGHMVFNGDGVLPYSSPLSLDVEAKDTQRYNFRVVCIYVDARTVTMTSSRGLHRPGLGRDPQVLHAVGKFAGLLFFPPKGKHYSSGNNGRNSSVNRSGNDVSV